MNPTIQGWETRKSPGDPDLEAAETSAAMCIMITKQPIHSSRRTAPPRRRTGFTLIETALATIIVGVGVLSIVSAQQAFHVENTWATNASIATRLGNEIREMT